MAVYVEYMLVKSQKASWHEKHLEEIFGVIRDKGLMLNPAKCNLGVRAGLFLRYIVTEKEIEVNQAKVPTRLALSPDQEET